MCLIWSLCVSCAVAPTNYTHLCPSQLQQFLKEMDSKKNFIVRKRERIITILEDEDTMSMYLNSLCWPQMFATPIFYVESYTGLLLFIFYFDLYQTCFFFIVVTTSVITTHWSLFLMRLVSAMPCQTMMWEIPFGIGLFLKRNKTCLKYAMASHAKM